MAGNVAEWVADYFGWFAEGPVVDPEGASEATSRTKFGNPLRVLRGGHFNWDLPMFFQVSYRAGHSPTLEMGQIGFRVALSPAAD
jgi:formylglycine-generating enzyme required for sulfatase activity